MYEVNIEMRMNDCIRGRHKMNNKMNNKLTNILPSCNKANISHHYLYDISFYPINEINYCIGTK